MYPELRFQFRDHRARSFPSEPRFRRGALRLLLGPLFGDINLKIEQPVFRQLMDSEITHERIFRPHDLMRGFDPLFREPVEKRRPGDMGGQAGCDHALLLNLFHRIGQPSLRLVGQYLSRKRIPVILCHRIRSYSNGRLAFTF